MINLNYLYIDTQGGPVSLILRGDTFKITKKKVASFLQFNSDLLGFYYIRSSKIYASTFHSIIHNLKKIFLGYMSQNLCKPCKFCKFLIATSVSLKIILKKYDFIQPEEKVEKKPARKLKCYGHNTKNKYFFENS